MWLIRRPCVRGLSANAVITDALCLKTALAKGFCVESTLCFLIPLAKGPIDTSQSLSAFFKLLSSHDLNSGLYCKSIVSECFPVIKV